MQNTKGPHPLGNGCCIGSTDAAHLFTYLDRVLIGQNPHISFDLWINEWSTCTAMESKFKCGQCVVDLRSSGIFGSLAEVYWFAFFCGGKQFMFCIWNICIYSSVIISVHKLNEAGTFFFKSDIWKDGNNVISLRLSSTHVFETAHIYAPACRDAREGNNHRFLTAWQHGYGCEGISSATMWSSLKAVSYLLNRTVCCQSNTVSTQLHIQPFLSFLFFFK